MIRILYTLIYSILILTLTGIPDIALAAISCSDQIYSGTNYKYSDALVQFVYYNGNTYAIAKSAVTGVSTSPDGYFDFIANIDSQYVTTGVDHSSLKMFFTSGVYGDAYPVTITDAATQKFIVDTYGHFMGQPTSLQSTYVNAWKDFGAMQPYVQMTGGLLSFTNWSSGRAPDVNTIPPQAVTMGSNGAWVNGQDGIRTAQVVEFIGQKLDCALDITPIVPPGPPQPIGQLCAQDLNGDGNIEPNETAPCVSTHQGTLCPIGAVNCVDNTSTPICPTGSTLNTTRDMCQADPTVTCGSGYMWDSGVDRCVKPVTCPDGGTYNANTNRCEKIVLNDCPPGYTYDVNRAICWMAVNCGPGAVFAPSRDRCETPPNWMCPTGFTYNSAHSQCEAPPYCPSPTSYNLATKRCEEGAQNTCPTGYSFNTILAKCVANVNCPSGGSLNSATDQCELATTSSCQPGWILNTSTGKCEKPPACASPGSYSAANGLCLAIGTNSCPTGYTYNSSLGTCVASPICIGGVYSSTNKRCEAASTGSCPDPSYTYNPSSGRCEKGPVCSQGTFNGTYHECLQNFTPSCTGSYVYNVNRLRCEMAPQCSTGAFNSVTNKCEWPQYTYYPATITGYTCPPGAGALNGAYCYTQCRAYDLKGFPPFNMGDVRKIHACDESYGIVTLNGTYESGRWVLHNQSFDTCSCYAAPGGSCLLKWMESIILGFILFPEYFDAKCNMLEGITYAPGTCYDDPNYPNVVCNVSSGTAATPIYGCNPGDTLVGNTCTHVNTGQVNPDCPGGTFDFSYHDCYTPYTPGCPPGTVYDSASNQCAVAPVCSGGAFDTATNVCFQAAFGGCPDGYTLSSTTCVAAPFCTTGGTYQPAIDYCSSNSTPQCPTGYTFNSVSGTCTQPANCGSGSLNASLNVCQTAITTSCTAGYTLNGSVCQDAPPCPVGGSYSSSLKMCDGGDNLCASRMVYDSVNNICYEPASCSTGTLNTRFNVCQTSATVNCGSMTWDPVAGVCYTPPICAPGAYDIASQECHASVTLNCGTYLWSPADSKCVETIVCPTDAAFSLNSTIAYSPLLDECVSDAQHDCLSGLSYITLPVEKCEAVPVCNGGTYDTTLHACTTGKSCPLGAQYTCMDNQGVFQCSPNQCFNPSNPPWSVVPHPPFDGSMLQDDARNPDGSCGGTLLIFTGKPSKCRPPGLTVGELNDCCKGEQVVAEDVGSGLQNGISTIRTIWDLSRIAYYSYMASVNQCQIISQEVSGVYQSTIVVTDTSGTVISTTAMSSLSPAVQAGVQTGVQTGSVVEGTTAYCMQLISEYTPVIAVASMIIMQILYGVGCDIDDVQTAEQIASHECHYVGEYCEFDVPLLGCFQKSKTYCCFNSMMARIIQEQGRPQLTTYGPTGSWGTPEIPNCKGFTPDEFESLDFSKIDFSEYIAQIQLNLANNIQNAQNKIQGKIQSRIQQIQNHP